MSSKILLSAAIIFSLLAVSCKTEKISSWEQFKSRYADDGFTLKINGGLFKLGSKIAAAAVDDKDSRQVLKSLSGLHGVAVHVIPIRAAGIPPEAIGHLGRMLQKDNYESLVDLRNGSDRVYLWAKGKGDEYKDPLILINSGNELLMVEMKGKITTDDIGSLAKAGQGLK